MLNFMIIESKKFSGNTYAVIPMDDNKLVIRINLKSRNNAEERFDLHTATNLVVIDKEKFVYNENLLYWKAVAYGGKDIRISKIKEVSYFLNNTKNSKEDIHYSLYGTPYEGSFDIMESEYGSSISGTYTLKDGRVSELYVENDGSSNYIWDIIPDYINSSHLIGMDEDTFYYFMNKWNEEIIASAKDSYRNPYLRVQ